MRHKPLTFEQWWERYGIDAMEGMKASYASIKIIKYAMRIGWIAKEKNAT